MSENATDVPEFKTIRKPGSIRREVERTNEPLVLVIDSVEDIPNIGGDEMCVVLGHRDVDGGVEYFADMVESTGEKFAKGDTWAFEDDEDNDGHPNGTKQ